MIIAFLQSEGKSPDIQILSQYLKEVTHRIEINALEVDNVFHPVLLKYHALFAEHPATFLEMGLLYTSALSDETVIVYF